jgi:hypothetical protein
LCPLACRLDPLAIVRQQGPQILPKAIGEKQGGAVRGQHLRHVVDHALRHGQGAIPDVDRQQQLALGVHRHPDPLGHTLQALDGLGLADLPVFDRAEQGKELIELDLPHAYIVQDVSGKRPELLCRFHEPVQDGVGVDLEDPRGAPDTSTLGQAREDPHDEVDGGARAVKERAEGLEKIAATGDTQQLPPGAA